MKSLKEENSLLTERNSPIRGEESDASWSSQIVGQFTVDTSNAFAVKLIIQKHLWKCPVNIKLPHNLSLCFQSWRRLDTIRALKWNSLYLTELQFPFTLSEITSSKRLYWKVQNIEAFWGEKTYCTQLSANFIEWLRQELKYFNEWTP